MDVTLAARKVAQWAMANAGAIGVDPCKVRAYYTHNPGGFGNLSFRLTDGRTQLHAKLGPPRKAARLRQWAYVSDYLTERYAAPKLIHVIDHEIVPGYPYGLVFEYIEGATPLADSRSAETSLTAIMETVAKLHRDDRLREMLPKKETRTYADAFEDEYIARFTEDLDGIREFRGLLRDFVPDDTISWFADEIERLRETVRQTPSFLSPALDVVHNDLNGNNVLTSGEDAFRIIDWDDLSGQGDAAMDYSVLLWPFKHKPSWALRKEKVRIAAGDSVVERLELYFRAKLLDDVVDVLADYVEAEQVPERREEVQRMARAVHLRALPRYLAEYGGR